MQLSNRVVLVTGGKRMGDALAAALAARQADVALVFNRSRAEAERAAAVARNAGRRGEIFRADLSDPRQCRGVVDEAAAALGRLDALVAMASVYEPVPFDRLDEPQWRRGLAIDLDATLFCATAAVPHLRAAGGGRIVTVADWTAPSRRPRYKGYLPYYVAKAAVVALTESLALELAGDGILVNAVAPGPIAPPPDMPQLRMDKAAAETPLGRWGGAAELAKVIVSLLETDFITGETVRVDGGRHLR